MKTRFEYTLLDYFNRLERRLRAQPLLLGGYIGPSGGIGGPPAGYIGTLPQSRVTYDTTEAATSGTPSSGQSLVHNLNHIRYRLVQLEGNPVTNLVVKEDGGVVASGVEILDFTGSAVETITPISGGVEITLTAGSGVITELDDVPDVTLTTPITGDVLTYNGAYWVNEQPSGGGSPLSVEYNGVEVASGVQVIDFEAGGLRAESLSPNEVTVTNPMGKLQALTSADIINWNLVLGNAYLNIAHSGVLQTPSNMYPGTFFLRVTQPASGYYNLSYSGEYYWEYGEKPSLTQGANKTDFIQFICDGNKMVGKQFAFNIIKSSPIENIPGLQVWLVANRINGLSNGDPISTWEDASGNNNDFTQSNSIEKPLFYSNEVNGYAVARFDDTNDGMTGTFSSSSGYLVCWIVAKKTGSTTYTRALQGSSNWLLGIRDATPAFYYFNGALLSGGSAGLGGWFVIACKQTSSAGKLYTPNGDYSNSQTGYPGTINLAYEGSTGEPWGGDIAEVVISNSDLSDSYIKSIVTVLENKYNI
jgi:hypothetical protein